MRYEGLTKICEKHKPQKIVEVGTWTGDRAIQMIQAAGARQYVGYDLFEEATEETDAAELNVKHHVKLQEVAEKIGKACPDCEVTLIGGNTRDTLHGQTVEADFAFIDGGHSVETIQGDFEAINSKITVLDDFYHKDNTGRGPDTEKFGCNKVVEGMKFGIIGADPVKDGGIVSMVVMPIDAMGPVQLKIKTRNCVPPEQIREQVQWTIDNKIRQIHRVRPHDIPAIFVSGGPSFKDHLPEIRGLQAQGAKLFCVKSAHDFLIEQGVIPWGCVLLDPRAHVVDFVENPHPEIRYFVASMCHRTTFERLKDRNAKYWAYHALVGAEEQKLIPKGELLVGGGCAAALRGISLARALGFGRFHLFGYDLIYRDGEPLKSTLAKEQIRVRIKDGNILQDEDGPYLTDIEKMAQAQELRQLLKSDMQVTLHGGGLVQELVPDMPGLESYG